MEKMERTEEKGGGRCTDLTILITNTINYM
jgi:hypothetical protein